jgi:membrane dipeptidase
MEEGGLDASFFIVYVGQDDEFTPEAYARAHDEAIAKFRAIHRLADSIAPDRIGLATSAADVRRIAASGRKVALIGVENGYPLGKDITRVKEFYDLGAGTCRSRTMATASFRTPTRVNGTGCGSGDNLSPSGRKWPRLNRVGIMIGVSHPSRRP